MDTKGEQKTYSQDLVTETRSLLALLPYNGVQIEIIAEVARAAYGGDRMFENHLIDTVVLHDDGEPVEVLDAAGEFRPID
jgi:hypothetical protein